MKLAELDFERPAQLVATEPPEARGEVRDSVKLLVSTPAGQHHSRFANLTNFLEAGDLLVVNRSATLPASLPAEHRGEPITLNLSTRYGPNLWLSEPRWSFAQSGSPPLEPGEVMSVAGLQATLIAPYPGLPRLWFMHFSSSSPQGEGWGEGTVDTAMQRYGQPIRYTYVAKPYPLESYQTIFADTPGSAEMPSAGRPFTERIVHCLQAKGVELASITLHTGVSSLELESENIEDQALYPEPFEVSPETAEAINRAKEAGKRVIAVGTTVVRALESAWNGHRLRAIKGFTRHYVHPGNKIKTIDGLITGLHDPKASHLAMLYALAGKDLIQESYQEAVQQGYHWHEFGDSHLILPA